MKLNQKVFKQEKDAIITYASKDFNLELKELKAFEIDGAKEKHVPVVKCDGNLVEVTVGEVAHPMQDVHFIEWISIETDKYTSRINVTTFLNSSAICSGVTNKCASF